MGLSKVNKIPSGWHIVKLGEVLTIHHGKRQTDIEDAEGKYPILATGGEIGRTNKFLYDQPSVLIGRKGTIDRPQYMDTPFWTVDTLFFSSIKEPNVPKFVYYLFCTIPWRRYNEASGVPSLSAKTIENIEVMIPKTAEEQAKIVQVLDDSSSVINHLEKLVGKASNIHNGLLIDLTSGNVRTGVDKDA